MALFLERSYKKVSVDDIARKAGVSKGGLFHHFPSKYDLGRDALIQYANEMMGGAMSEEFLSLEPKEQIKFFIDMSTEIIVRDVNMGRVFVDIYEEALEREEDIAVWIEFLSGYIDQVAGIFEKLGEPRPKMRSLIMLSSIDGFAMYYLMLVSAGKQVDMNDYKLELYRMYLGDD